MKNTITSSLRKAISQVAPTYPIKIVFSDSRRQKMAVGVKVVGKPFTSDEKVAIHRKMVEFGWGDVISIRRNDSKNNWSNGSFNGTRFTYYK